MGLLACKSDYARRRSKPCGAAHLQGTQTRISACRSGWLVASVVSLATSTSADPIRLATFAAPISRDGPGLLLRDILKRDDAQINAVQQILLEVRPDILVLTEFDNDFDNIALRAFADQLASDGLDFGFLYAEMGNNGLMTDLDLDQDGYTRDATDAQGYGRFAGDDGVAILSRWPIGEVRSFRELLWTDLPGATLPVDWPEDVLAIQRLSSSSHLVVSVETDQGPLSLLAFAATPPIFDGPEDRNGLRAGDETRLWSLLLTGALGEVPTNPVVIGKANIDPVDGDGQHAAIQELLSLPMLQDPKPSSRGGEVSADAGHVGDPALDTADWPDGSPGNLRVSYILPSLDWTIAGAGVFWPAPDDPLYTLLGKDGLAAGPHRLVWVDISR